MVMVVMDFFFYSQIHVPGVLPQPELEWDYNLGDIILGMSVISEGCVSDRVKLVDRLPVVVAHGFCHLIGYRHGNDAQWNDVWNREETMMHNMITHASTHTHTHSHTHTH